jgi:hypothetical protein
MLITNEIAQVNAVRRDLVEAVAHCRRPPDGRRLVRAINQPIGLD